MANRVRKRQKKKPKDIWAEFFWDVDGTEKLTERGWKMDDSQVVLFDTGTREFRIMSVEEFEEEYEDA